MAAVADGSEVWRELAARLVAAASLLDIRLEHGRAPDTARGAELLEAGRLLTVRLETLATRIGTAHHDQLDEPTLDRLRAAVTQLRMAVDALTGLPEALNPNYHR